MPLSDLCLEISLYYCTKARTNSLPIYSLEGVKQFQMSKQVDRQGKKAQTIKEFSSFFNAVWRAICHFKPTWFDYHQAQFLAIKFIVAYIFNKINQKSLILANKIEFSFCVEIWIYVWQNDDII